MDIFQVINENMPTGATMKRLCVIEGDGIGREVIPAAVAVLQRVIPDLVIQPADAGWDCFLQTGRSVPKSTLDQIRECGAALFGAVSSPARKVDGYRSAILIMRQELDLYANIRPVKSLPGVSPRQDVDLIIVRENTEGLYSGRERLEGEIAIAERVITRRASERIARAAVQICQQTCRRKISIVHKANVLPVTDGLFRDCVRTTITNMDSGQPPIGIEEVLVDLAAYIMVSEPENFDVMITTNLFGDILSDEAAYWAGGMGLAPSINLGESIALAEPVHGSAPDIAGKGIANPIAAILSAALLCEYYWDMPSAALRIWEAVCLFLSGNSLQNHGDLTTTEITTRIIKNLG
jgi:homoisocitrate dehydrogenase